ncbi:MAG: NADH:ubiquinone reductase (Na(+)-transporting) subunit F [Bacteroidota bacterium]
MLILSATITIVSSIIVFLIFLLLLIILILYAKAKLIPSGLVKVTINGEKILEVNAGDTLLTTLGNSKIFLPSACGGGGTCAMCKCQVLEGGGEILPTEKPYFKRKEIQEKWRMGCQVKVKQDMEITIPEEVFGIRKWECEVVSNDNVATYIKEFAVNLPEGETVNFKAGGYIQIDVPECEIDFKTDIYKIDDQYREDYDSSGVWDLKMKNDEPISRAYSMANHPAEGSRVMLNIRIATPPWDREKNKFMDVNPGICSSYIFSRKPGDKVIVSGPYGEFFMQDTDREIVFIGGGAGMAPMRSHIFHLFHTLRTTRKVNYFYGGRSLRELFYTEQFRAIEKEFPNFKYTIALSEPLPEDNWTGETGFIHQVVYDTLLKNHSEPEEIEYYMCGPPLMNSAVLKMLDDLGVEKEMIRLDEF